MPARTDLFDLGRLRLSSGEGRRLDLAAPVEPLRYGDEDYAVVPYPVPVRLDVSRTTHQGWSLRLRFGATLTGPCMRCLAPAEPRIDVDAREIDQPGGGDELSSPYVADQELDLHAWVRDALALALPATLLCREDCAGLCAECGADLNLAGPEHDHPRAPDPRWDALRALKLPGQ
jgi:DUF177 domain-containing protein